MIKHCIILLTLLNFNVGCEVSKCNEVIDPVFLNIVDDEIDDSPECDEYENNYNPGNTTI